MPKKQQSHKLLKTLGVAALAAGAAAGYYFTGPQGKKHQAKAKAWVKAAKKDMDAKLKQMEGFSKQAYTRASSEVLAKYKQAKNIDPKEITAFGNELKKHWNEIAKKAVELGGAKKAPVKSKRK